MNKLTLLALLGFVAVTNACNKCGGHKPDEPDLVESPGPSEDGYNVWVAFALRWQDIQDRLATLQEDVAEVEEGIDAFTEGAAELAEA